MTRMTVENAAASLERKLKKRIPEFIAVGWGITKDGPTLFAFIRIKDPQAFHKAALQVPSVWKSYPQSVSYGSPAVRFINWPTLVLVEKELGIVLLSKPLNF